VRLVGVVAGLLVSWPCHATLRTVTNLNDSGAGSLRDTIAASVANDTINFAVTGTISLTSGQLAIGRSLTIIGPGASQLTVSGNSSSRVFVTLAGSVNISGLTIANGKASLSDGGGISNATVLIITSCTLANNTATEVGGGIFNASTGALTVNTSTLLTNVAAVGAGGAIYNAGTLIVNTSTLYGNKSNGDRGGAIYNGATVAVSNSTISGSSSVLDGGGLASFATASIFNTIIAGNVSLASAQDCFGTYNSQGYNLIGKTNLSSGWVASDLTGSSAAPLNPLLGPLQDNGGPTFTMALLPGSAAIDAGKRGTLSADQRGAPKPNDNLALGNAPGSDGSDIGAFEVCPNLTVNVSGGGVVIKDPDQPFYLYNANVMLRAVPYYGWTFSGWSGSVTGPQNPLNVVMTVDKSFTANLLAGASPCDVTPSGLANWWPAGTNANDIIGGFNGTLVNGATFAPGKVGQAFSFNGVAAYIDFGNSVGNFNISDFTVEFWMKTTATNPEFILGKRAICGYDSFWDILVEQGGVLAVELYEDYTGVNNNVITGQHAVNNGAFHHVALVRQSDTARLYLDGGLEGTSTAFITVTLFNSASTTAGVTPCTGTSGSQYYQGLLDELTFFNRALSQAEIQAIYNAGSSGKCLTPAYITSFGKSGNSATASWLAEPALTYRLQYRTNLNASTPWADVSGDVTATASSASKTDTLPSGTPQRMYRVELFR
jgi:hypothetical protein